MKITTELLTAIGWKLLSEAQIEVAAEAYRKNYTETEVPAAPYCLSDEVWELVLFGHRFHLRRCGSSFNYMFGIATDRCYAYITDVEECIASAFQQGFYAGYEERAEQTRKFLAGASPEDL